MPIFLVERTDAVGYDEYDAVVVVAADEDEAKLVRPSSYDSGWGCLTPPPLQVTRIGIADDETPRVILGSFNAA